jgi:hypothetical protein
LDDQHGDDEKMKDPVGLNEGIQCTSKGKGREGDDQGPQELFPTGVFNPFA